MHKTINPNILWYVDTIEYKKHNNKDVLNGWIFHTTNKITNLTIAGQDIRFQPSVRNDVKKVYPYAIDIVGFQIEIKEEYRTKPVQVHFENGEILEIDSLEKFYAFYSGFNIGHKNLIVVDNFYYNPDLVRNYAINGLQFNNSDYHRGKRSDRFILNGTKEKLEEILGRKILNWNYEGYANGVFQFCTSYDPIVYHVDTQQFAGVVFLTPNAPLEAGTATYRSKITGATRFDNPADDTELYEKTFKGVSDEMNFYDNTSYELVDKVSNVYNRLVMWDAKAIHAATAYFGDNINNSRFFQLFFFDVE